MKNKIYIETDGWEENEIDEIANILDSSGEITKRELKQIQKTPQTTTSTPKTTQSTENCDPSYPDVCIPPYPPDLDCKEYRTKNSEYFLLTYIDLMEIKTVLVVNHNI